jgi:hypothetical protein
MDATVFSSLHSMVRYSGVRSSRILPGAGLISTNPEPVRSFFRGPAHPDTLIGTRVT